MNYTLAIEISFNSTQHSQTKTFQIISNTVGTVGGIKFKYPSAKKASESSEINKVALFKVERDVL